MVDDVVKNESKRYIRKQLRFDEAELAAPKPHVYDLPELSDIRRLAKWLDRDDLTLNEFGEKLARYPGLCRYVVAVANYSAVRAETMIRDPSHAAAFLGIAGLERLFEPLLKEVA